jgi:glucan phosphoethanolaminetransferase (alkaline phosphatase superfamily)
MNATVIEGRFRRFLLIVVVFLCLGTMVELYLEKHTKEPLQFVPFALCGLSILSVLAVLLRPQRIAIWVMRLVMLITLLGSALGVYEHLSSNINFEVEMHPKAAVTTLIGPALMGAAPIIAPGMLALAAVLAIAATYYHPALGKRSDNYSFESRLAKPSA